MTEPTDPTADAPGVPRMPFEQPYVLQPAPRLRALQQQGPLHRVRTRMGDEAWLVTSYDEVRSLYSGDELGRSHPKPDDAARLTASALFGGRPREDFVNEDANRAWFKAILHGIVAPKQLHALRPWIEALVTELLDELADAERPADFIDLVAMPLPTLVICKLLGVPAADLPLCREFAEAIASAGDEERSAEGQRALTRHLWKLLTTGAIEPDGLLSKLTRPPYRLPVGSVAEIGAALLFTGHHTTAVAIGYGLLLLLSHPDQHQALLADPSRLPAAIEEFLRVGNFGLNVGGGNGIPTYARKDMDVAGVPIKAGDLILLDTGTANHDERIFEDPYRFDIDRRNACPHLTFGYGQRYCPGAPLARLEMSVLFEQLLPQFPSIRLAVDPKEIRAHDNQITGGLVTLPVTW